MLWLSFQDVTTRLRSLLSPSVSLRSEAYSLERDRVETELHSSESRLQETLKEIQTLYQVTSLLNRSRNLKEISEGVLDAVQKAFRTDRTAILVLDGDGILRFKAWRGLSDAYRQAAEGYSPWPPEARDPSPVLIEDVEQEPGLGPFRDVVLGDGIHAIGFIPMMLRGKLIGRFALYYGQPHPFPESEMRLAQTVANHVAMAIERKRAEEELQRFNEELEKRVAERSAELSRVNAELLQSMEQRHKLEEQLRHAQKMEALGTLAGGIAHNFNNILAIILGYARQLRFEGEPDHDQIRRSIETILEAGKRGAKTVQQLLTFARKAALENKPVDVNALVCELSDIMREIFPKSIAVGLDLSPSLPPVLGDYDQLQQGLINICLNARDAMPESGTLTIRTSKVMGGELAARFADAVAPSYLRIDVADTGVGIDEETRKRIFEPFFTTKQLKGATGLGLSVVYGIIKGHRGFINVDSELGRGTTFSIYLPLEKHAAESSQAREEDERREVRGEGKTILVVEDERTLLELTKSRLEKRGFQVLTARDGEEAVRVYRSHTEVALVLLDLGLPRQTGREVYLRLKEINPEVKVIVLSGYLDPGIRERMVKDGIADFLQKPCSLDEIERSLQSVLGKDGELGLA